MNALISKNSKEIKRLCEKYEVKSMYLFGSGSQGDFTDSSDIDILISFQDEAVSKVILGQFSFLWV